MIKGYPSGTKLDRVSSNFATIEPIRLDQYGMSVLSHMFLYQVSSQVVTSATTSVITCAAHGSVKGDVLRFTSGVCSGIEIKVFSVTTGTITLAENLAVAPGGADTFIVTRHKYPMTDSAGNLQAVFSYTRNGASQNVLQDTVVPANNRPLPVNLVDAAGNINHVTIDSPVPLPTGAATEATLAAQSAKLPATLGQKAMAASMSVALASDQSALPVTGAFFQATQPVSGTFWQATQPVSGTFFQATQPISAVSLPLPAGAATSALQTTGNTSVASIDTKTPALGQALAAASVPVVLTAAQLITLTPLATVATTGTYWQATQPVSIASLPALTAGAAVIGAVTQGGTWTVQPGNTPNTTAWLVRESGKASANAPARNDYTGTSVTTAAYVQLVASTTSITSEIEIFDSSGQTLVLAVGGAGSEVNQINIFPGGNGRIPLLIAAGSRVSIKAVSATASVGEIDVNFYN